MKLPRGYSYSALYAGIRKDKRDDLSMIKSDTPASAAAVFTTNRVQAAPVVHGRKALAASKGRVSAVLINAGNANCATRTGFAVTGACCAAVAEAAGVEYDQVFPASTGVIGVEMDAAKVTNNVAKLVKGLSPDRFHDVARAIMTTDLVPKIASADLTIGSREIAIAGMTKGSGMIQPNMATTLGFVVTDAVVGLADLKRALAAAVGRSYNRISVDGDTSTNDTVAVLANGASGVKPSLKAFEAALTQVLESLATQIVRDGEGAKKLITIDVEGAMNNNAAEKIARSIANSPLFKTAIAGSDPNWGRILSAAGYAGVTFDPRKTDIDLQGVPVCRGGLAADFSEDALKAKLDEKDCRVRFVIRGKGRGRARFWTCDFTEEYIRINASYRT